MFPELEGLTDSIDDLFSSDSVKSGLKAAGKGVYESLQNKSSSAATLSQLERNVPALGNIAAEAQKSKMMQSEDPFALEATWRDRLATFAKISRETGTSIK